MLKSLSKHFDPWSIVVIVLTLVLFVASIFIKGVTNELLLLEAGVFLVSVKLILIGHKNSVASAAIQQELKRLGSMLETRNLGT